MNASFEASVPSANALHQVAREAMGRRDMRAAREALDALLDNYPAYAPGWLAASVLELDLRQPARALASVERALALGAPNPAVRVQHVRCLHAVGKLAQACAALPVAERAVAHHPHLQHALGTAASALGEHVQAYRLMEAACAQLPDDPALAHDMAAELRALGRLAEAQVCLDRAVRLAPQDDGGCCPITAAPADGEQHLNR
jgi:predicted Zn-dependent protease